MSSQVFSPNTEAAILARIIQSDDRELIPDAARYLLSMKLPQTIRTASMNCRQKLEPGHSQKASGRRAGELPSPSGTLLGVMQSKGRRLIKSEKLGI